MLATGRDRIPDQAWRATLGDDDPGQRAAQDPVVLDVAAAAVVDIDARLGRGLDGVADDPGIGARADLQAGGATAARCLRYAASWRMSSSPIHRPKAGIEVPGSPFFTIAVNAASSMRPMVARRSGLTPAAMARAP